MTNGNRSADLTRTTLAVLCIGVIVSATFWILRPFLTSTVWAAMIVVATWPLLLGVEAKLGGRRGLAVLVLTVLLAVVLLVPLAVAITAMANKADALYAWIKVPGHLTLPAPPEWLHNLPFAGPKLAERWQKLAAAGSKELASQLEPFAKGALRWLLASTGSFGALLLRLVLTIVICAIFFAKGETAARGATRFARRLAGRNGEEAVILAAKAIRAVALGVVLTALLQAACGGVGLAVCGVPGVGVLTAVMFMLCVAQVGPALVLIPAIVWLYSWQGQPGWGTVLLVWSILVGIMDNFIRPVLIKKGVDLPLVLIFAGVLGGLLGFGVIGLFIGPVALAVAYTLIAAWVDAGEREPGGHSADAEAPERPAEVELLARARAEAVKPPAGA